MIKMWILIMVVSGDRNNYSTPVTIQQEFNSIETCQQAMNSIKSQVYKVHSSGCYQK